MAAYHNKMDQISGNRVRASDVSTAVREVSHARWPPRAAGFRLLDHTGREVLGRQEGSRPT